MQKDSAMIVTFFGHSHFSKAKEYKQKIIDLLLSEVCDTPVNFYLGGYGDFDTLAYECCKKYKEQHPEASLIFITPYITEEYDRNHLRYYRAKYDDIFYPELEKIPPKFAIVYRNRWMIEKSDLVICGITHDFGGAYKTYLYAKKKKKKIFNITDWDT